MPTRGETAEAVSPSERRDMYRSTSRGSSNPNRRRQSFRSEKDHDAADHAHLSRELSRQSARRNARWWNIRWFRGMIDDVKRRAPFYISDWTDAWDYRVVPATVYMYFAKYVDNKRSFDYTDFNTSFSCIFWQASMRCYWHRATNQIWFIMLTYHLQYPASFGFLAGHVC